MCVDVDFVGEVCGSELATYVPALSGDLPYVVFNATFDISDICSSADALNLPSECEDAL